MGTYNAWPTWAWGEEWHPADRAWAVLIYLRRQCAPAMWPSYRAMMVTFAAVLAVELAADRGVLLAPQSSAVQWLVALGILRILWLIKGTAPRDLRLLTSVYTELAAHPLDAATRQELAALTRGWLSFPEERAIGAALAVTLPLPEPPR